MFNGFWKVYRWRSLVEGWAEFGERATHRIGKTVLHTCSDLFKRGQNFSHFLALLSYKINYNVAPKHLLDICFKARTQHYNLRHTQSFDTPIPRTQLFLESPLFKSSAVFDSLPPCVKILTSFSAFQKKAAQHILSTHFDCPSYPYYH